MAGMDGYFGPREPNGEDSDDWDIENEEYYRSRRSHIPSEPVYSNNRSYTRSLVVKPRAPVHEVSDDDQGKQDTSHSSGS